MWAVFVPQGKCYKYWPSEGATLNTGHIEVTGVEEEGRAHFLIRTFDLRQLKVTPLRVKYSGFLDNSIVKMCTEIVILSFNTSKLP